MAKKQACHYLHAALLLSFNITRKVILLLKFKLALQIRLKIACKNELLNNRLRK